MFKRLFNLIASMFRSLVSGFEARNPAALIEAEKHNLRNEIVRFNKGLAEQAGFVYRLASQLKDSSQQAGQLRRRINILLQAGDRATAARLALQLSELNRNNDELATRCRVAEETYQKLEKSREQAVAGARTRIERLENLVSQTEIIEAQNEMLSMVQGLSFNAAFSQSSLETTSEIIEKSHVEALGRARVSGNQQHQVLQDLDLQESERKIMEERALAEFISLNAIPSDGEGSQSLVVPVVKVDRVA